MGNKRFTDKSKWRNEWFRTLPQKAKLAWTYLCDECDFCGIWKADYGLAGFQLDFSITKENLKEWFGNKLYFFNDDKVLIIGFFEFQYSESKDTWTAKVKARSHLEKLGFSVVNNKVILTQINSNNTTMDIQPPTVVDGVPPVLIDINIEGVVDINKGGVGENFPAPGFYLEHFYETYPNKVNKAEGLRRLAPQMKTETNLSEFKTAIENYKRFLGLEKNKTWMQAKQWDVFVGAPSKDVKPWHEWVNPDPSVFEDTTTQPKKPKHSRASIEDLESVS